MKFEVGDVVMRPLPHTVGVNNINDYVATVVEARTLYLTVVTGSGVKMDVDGDEVMLVASHKDTINAITNKGVELCKRVTS